LELKATSNISRETLLLKIFKFIDLNGSGEIRKPEFLKAAAKAGVLLDDPEVPLTKYPRSLITSSGSTRIISRHSTTGISFSK
jgi:hypothetical protein